MPLITVYAQWTHQVLGGWQLRVWNRWHLLDPSTGWLLCGCLHSGLRWQDRLLWSVAFARYPVNPSYPSIRVQVSIGNNARLLCWIQKPSSLSLSTFSFVINASLVIRVVVDNNLWKQLCPGGHHTTFKIRGRQQTADAWRRAFSCSWSTW